MTLFVRVAAMLRRVETVGKKFSRFTSLLQLTVHGLCTAPTFGIGDAQRTQVLEIAVRTVISRNPSRHADDAAKLNHPQSSGQRASNLQSAHLFSIRSCPLPDGALLARYLHGGGYADCYTTEIVGAVTHAQFVSAFYTTWVFKLERWILSWAVSKPSTDAQAMQLAAGAINAFAAWMLEDRSENQLLMCDFQDRTRSWLMVAPGADGTNTRLYFGSAVVPKKRRTTDESRMGFVFRALLGFHKLYSIVLLAAARSRLLKRRQMPLP